MKSFENVTGLLTMRNRNFKPRRIKEGEEEYRTMVQVVGVIAMTKEEADLFCGNGKNTIQSVVQGEVDETGQLNLRISSDKKLQIELDDYYGSQSADGLLHSHIWRV